MNARKLTLASVAIALGAVLAVTLFVGCNKAEVGDAGSSSAPRQFKIGMSQCNLGEPWRVQMNADLQAAASQHPELKIIFKDAQNDTLQQRAQIEEFVSAKMDLIIVSP